MIKEKAEMQSEIKTPPFSFKFKRIEKKYWMNEEQYKAVFAFLEKRMVPDEFGESTVLNVYYDTPDYALIRNSIERPLFKEKLRVRCYDVPNDSSNVFIELKRKLNGVGYKRRISLPYSEAMKLLDKQDTEYGDPQIKKEILDFLERYDPKPRVLIAYERYALFGKDDKEFRITFDRNLRYRTENLEMKNGSDGLPFVKKERAALLEIKSSTAIPVEIAAELSRLGIYQAPFSKVGECFTTCIAPELLFENK